MQTSCISFQGCILPLQSQESDNEVRIRARNRSKKTGDNTVKKVAITLNDCLACSGCITSAETILIKVIDALKS